MDLPLTIPDATTQPDAYVQALLALVDGHDPVAIYAETPHRLQARVAHLAGPAWQARPELDAWNAHDVLGHLLDVDIVYGFRWRLALTADVPAYPGYDEGAFARLPKLPPAELLTAFLGLRAANLALIRSLDAAALVRRGVHGEQGPEDVERMIRKVAGHDLAHLDQLERALTAVAAHGQRAGVTSR